MIALIFRPLSCHQFQWRGRDDPGGSNPFCPIYSVRTRTHKHTRVFLVWTGVSLRSCMDHVLGVLKGVFDFSCPVVFSHSKGSKKRFSMVNLKNCQSRLGVNLSHSAKLWEIIEWRWTMVDLGYSIHILQITFLTSEFQYSWRWIMEQADGISDSFILARVNHREWSWGP